ncbi:unnamed protein product [Brachionus calyciflorus]|uniref:BHLH domain-containing protein n=1 Tax=Brachionus calyciflorus TaxID=104777 RepID=A0A813S4P8_9BILA|nr:unnamed protein product [Brachionus calyciflorus]
MNYEIDKIDSIDIYSFNKLDLLKEFALKNNLVEYDLKNDPNERSKKYNTRSRLNMEVPKLNDSLSVYLRKLNSDSNDEIDSIRDELVGATDSKRKTRSQKGKMPECGKAYCRLGCICEPSENVKKKFMKKHCGRFECMFECNCSRRLRSSTRKKEPEHQKASSTGSVCSRSSSNSSIGLRKSKRCRNQVNYFVYSKQGESPSSSNPPKKINKFKPYSDTVELDEYNKLKLEILTNNYEIQKYKVLDFIKNFLIDFRNLEWKELIFSYEKTLNVRLLSKPLLSARISKFRSKEGGKHFKVLENFLKKFSHFTVQTFKYVKKNDKSSNKENNEPDKPSYRILPRLLCRKSQKTKAPELKQIFNNLDDLFRQVPKKYEKISESLKEYRNFKKINLFNDEQEYLSKNPNCSHYDPFSDEKLIIESYKIVDSRDIVDLVSSTLNDMINVVCTHKENNEKKIDLNEFLPSLTQQNYVRPNLLKRKSNIILLSKEELQGEVKNKVLNYHPQRANKTYVKILNSNEKNVMPISIVNKSITEKPIFKVSFNNDEKTSLACIKQELLSKCFISNRKRNRKQDLSSLSAKVINVNATSVISPVKIDHFDLNAERRQLIISHNLFLKSKKITNTHSVSDSFDDNLIPLSIKEEPIEEINPSISTYSQQYLTIENNDEMENEVQTQPNEDLSNFQHGEILPSSNQQQNLSMLKLENIDECNTNSSYSNSDFNLIKKKLNFSNFQSSRSSSSSLLIKNSNYNNKNHNQSFDNYESSDDSDLDNEDEDIFSKSSCSSSNNSNGRTNISLSVHSVRERQRRLRLKNLLTKLKYALYDIDEKTTNERKNPKLKHSKQATLAEAADYIKSIELRGQEMDREFQFLRNHHAFLKNKLEYLLNN